MAKARSKSPLRSRRRERKHVLAANVLTPRIIFYTFLRTSRKAFTYTLVTCTLALITWGIFKGAKHLFIEGERFMLNELTISPEPSPNSFLSYTTLSALTGIESGVSIFSYDLSGIKEGLEKRPEIKSVNLKRRLPGTITIDIDERVPVAKILVDNSTLLLDAEGFCFNSTLATGDLVKTLPLIISMPGNKEPVHAQTEQLTGTGPKRAVHLTALWNSYAINERLLSVEVKNYHSLEAVTESGSELLFGYYEHDRQVRDYCSLKAYCNTTGQQVLSANLLPYKNIPVVFDKIISPVSPASNIYSAPRPAPTKNSPSDDVLLILEQG